MEIARNDLDKTNHDTARRQARGRYERQVRAGYLGLQRNISTRTQSSYKHGHHTKQARGDLICPQNQIQLLSQVLSGKRNVFQTELLLRKRAFLRTTKMRFSEHPDRTRRGGFGRSTHQADSLPTLQKAGPAGSLLKYPTGRTAVSPTNSQETISKIPTDRDRGNPTADRTPAFWSIPSYRGAPPGQPPLPVGGRGLPVQPAPGGAS